MIIRDISLRLSNYIAKELNLESDKPVIDYGLQIFLGGLLKISSLMIVSYLMGVFNTTMLVVLAASFLRILSGGPHCTSYWRCYYAVHFVFIFLGLTSSKLIQVINYLNLGTSIITLGCVFLVLVMYLWAPGEHKERILTERKKQLSKFFSIAVILIFYLFSLAFFKTISNYAIPLFLGFIWQSFTITPMGYRFVSLLDRLLIFKR